MVSLAGCSVFKEVSFHIWFFSPFSSSTDTNQRVRVCVYLRVCVCACMLSCIQLCMALRAIAKQAPLPMVFSRQEHWSGLPLPPPGDRSYPGIQPTSLELLVGSLVLHHQGKPWDGMVSSKFSVQEEIIYKLVSEHSVPYMMLVSGPQSFVASWPEEAWILVLSRQLSSSVHARWGSNSESVVAVWKSCARLLMANSLQPHGL